MEYAIVETGGKQYKVTPGMVLAVDSLGVTSGEFSFDKVLLTVAGADVEVGKPYVSGMVVKAKVLGVEKGDKIYVSKFKAKARYRRTIGFRSSLTSVEILPFGKQSKETKKEEVKTTAKKAK